MTDRKPKTYSQYQTMRRENKRQYHSPTVQRQILEDRISLGNESFYATSDDNNQSLNDKLTKVIISHLAKEEI